MITFSRYQAPCRILRNGQPVGNIFPCHTAPLIRCPTCGNQSTNPRVTDYGLSLKGILWRNGDVVPSKKGGNSCFYATRLRDVKAKAEEVLQ